MAATDVLQIPIDTRQIMAATIAFNSFSIAGDRIDKSIDRITRSLRAFKTASRGLSLNINTRAIATAQQRLERLNTTTSQSTQSLRTYSRALNSVSNAAASVVTPTLNANRSIQRLDVSVVSANRNTGLFTRSLGGLAAAAVSLLAINDTIQSFRQFEKGLVGVGKTADISGQELDDFGESIESLSLSIPIATSELLEIAAVAGQLGIKGSRNLIQFTEAIAKFTRSTNVGATQAALGISRLLTITKENISEAGRLASQIVALGNDFKIFEDRILDVAEELSVATVAFDLTSGEVVALSTAIAEMGVPAERARSVIGKTFRAIKKSIDEGGDSFKVLQKITGDTGDSLRKDFGISAVTVFEKFLIGLERIRTTTNDAEKVMEEFGLTGELVKSTIPGLAKNIESVTAALNLQRRELNQSVALDKEFKASLDTLDSSMLLFGNTIDAASVTAGGFISELINLPGILDTVSKGLQRLFGLERLETLEALRKKIGEVKDSIAEESKVGTISKFLGLGLTKDQATNIDNLNSTLESLKKELADLAVVTEKATSKNNDLSKANEGLASETLSMTDAAKKATESAFSEIEAFDKLLKIQNSSLATVNDLNAARKKEEETLKASKKALDDAKKSSDALLSSQLKSNTSLEMQIKEIGKTQKELRKLNIERATAAKNNIKQTDANEKYRDSLEEEIDLLKERNSIITALEDAERADKARQAALDQFNESLSSIEDKARTVFSAFFDSGKSAFETLTQVLKDTLIKALFDLTVKKWIFNIGANITGGAGGSIVGAIGSAFSEGAAGGGGITGGIGNVLSLGKSAFDAFAGGGGLAGGLINSSFGASIGLSTAAPTTLATATSAQLTAASSAGSAGLGTTFTATQAGAAVSAVASALLPAGLGFAIGSISESPVIGGIGGAAQGALIGSIVPGIGTLAGAIIGGIAGIIGGALAGEPIPPQLFGILKQDPGTTAVSAQIGNQVGRGVSGEAVQSVRDVQVRQVELLENLLKQTRTNLNPAEEVVALSRRTNFLIENPDPFGDVFLGFKDLAESNLLEGVSAGLSKALESATTSEEILQAISSFIAARDAFESTLDSFIDSAEDINVAESALINLNNQFDLMAKQAGDLGVSLARVEQARSAAIASLTKLFIDGIEAEIANLSDPNGAALTALQDWRESSIKEAEALGAGMVQVEELFNLKRMELLGRISAEGLSDLSKAVAKEKSIISKSANDISFSMAGLSSTLSTLSSSLSAIQRIGNVSSQAGFDAAISILDSALDFSKSGQRLADFEGFADALSVITKVDQRQFGTSFDFQRALGQSESLITSLIEETEAQLTTEEMSLESINSAVNRLDQIIVESQNQVDVLLGIDNSLLSVNNALSALGSSVVSAGGDFNVPSFAVGTNVVPFNTLANIHKGERIIPAADNRELMARLGNDEMSNEIRALREDIKSLVSINTSIAFSTHKINKRGARWDGEGLPAERVPTDESEAAA